MLKSVVSLLGRCAPTQLCTSVAVACVIAFGLSGCATDYYSLGDISRSSVEPHADGRVRTPFSTQVEESRARAEKRGGAKVTKVPEQTGPGDKPHRTAVRELLNNKRVKVSSIDGVSVKQFAKLYFNDLLDAQVNIHPTLQANSGKIFLMANGEVSGSAAVELAQAALEPHGIAVSYEKAGFILKPIDAMLAETPPTIVNRSDAETPDDLKPVVQFVPLTAIEPNLAHQLLQTITTKRVKVTALQSANSVVISGPGADVGAAVAAVRTIDVPRYSGSKVATITPTYVSAKAFSGSLTQVLKGEGYTVSASDGAAGAIKVVPVEAINAVVVFAQNEKLLNRALHWGTELDKPADNGESSKTFIFKVKNMAAEQLVGVLTGVQTKSNSSNQDNRKQPNDKLGTIQVASAASPSTTTDASGRSGQSNLLQSVQFVVDPHSNRILVQGTDSDYARIRPLLEQLDVPTRTVLIEVAIAEVSLNSDAKFGVEWLIDNLKIGGKPVVAQTLKGLGLGSGGMSFALNASNLQVIISALASNNRVQILSTPRIVAKSGGTARIEVGTDVPIITSQRAGGTSVVGTTDILQNVEYRKTGVILTVKPVIHGDDRIELELEQELSEAASNPNKSIASPIIINRRVVTQLSVADSMTAVVGGLFSDSGSRGDTGVPGLKDIPLLGQAFRTDTRESRKTELLIFLRPFVIGGPKDMSDLAHALRRRLDDFGKQPKVAIDRILGINEY